jgi:hypothetical protein
MAWGKDFELRIGESGSEQLLNAIDASRLDISFKIFRSNIFGQTKAEFTIWNPSSSTEAMFMRPDISDIQCFAGYLDDGKGLIFAGHLQDAHPEWSGPDRKITLIARPMRPTGFVAKQKVIIDNYKIKAKDLNDKASDLEKKATDSKNKADKSAYKAQANGLREQADELVTQANKQMESSADLNHLIWQETTNLVENSYINLGYGPNTPIKTVMTDIATLAGIKLIGADTLDMKLLNGYHYTGSVRGAFNELGKKLFTYGYRHHIDLKEWIVYSRTKRTVTSQIAFLDSSSGLLGVAPERLYSWDQQQPEVLPPKKTWEVRSILNPAYAPNAVVQIDSTNNIGMAPIKGLYLVESVEFYGDNMDGEYGATLIVSEQ